MISFVKAHACGNDFLVVEDALAQGKHSELARVLCARNTGIGADGVEYVASGKNGVVTIRLFNADGSEGELSGNGTRCVAAWFAYSEGRKVINLDTKAGPRQCHVIAHDGNTFQMKTEMGVPTVQPHVAHLEGNRKIQGAKVFVGNPHYAIFVESKDFSIFGQTWQKIGENLCWHSDFPEGTNVEFVRIIDKQTIEFRIYERGVGPTLSSGTGTCASSAASISLMGVDRKLTVIAEGGVQTVDWPGAKESMLLTGPASIVARGEAYLS